MEGVEYIKYLASPKLWVKVRWKGKDICGGGYGGYSKSGRVE
jgi:hypothetical protein